MTMFIGATTEYKINNTILFSYVQIISWNNFAEFCQDRLLSEFIIKINFPTPNVDIKNSPSQIHVRPMGNKKFHDKPCMHQGKSG